MGVIVKISCKACGSHWQCRTGCGLQHGDFAKVAGLFPEETAQTLLNAARQTEFPIYDFALRPALCEYCTDIVSVPVLKMRGNDTPYVGTCAGCGREVRVVEDFQKTHCPVCQKGPLTMIETGHWD